MRNTTKLQLVVDPIIAEGLKRLPGKTKADKIRWALCTYQEVLMLKDHEKEKIMARAGERYRNGHSV